MDKVIFHCEECDTSTTIEYEEISDLVWVVCSKCGSDHIFIRKFNYKESPDKTPIKLGDRGCGTPGRFK